MCFISRVSCGGQEEAALTRIATELMHIVQDRACSTVALEALVIPTAMRAQQGTVVITTIFIVFLGFF
jgi:hypothetical protein